MNSQETLKPCHKLLVVDDSLSSRKLYGSYLRDRYDLTISSNGLEALNCAKNQHFDLYITDLMMPGMDGITFIKKLRQIHPDAGVIVVSQTEEIDLAIGAFRQKPLEFLRKPIKKNLLLNALERNLEVKHLRSTNLALKRESCVDPECPDPVMGQSPVMTEFWDKVQKVAKMDIAPAILVTGESGTGKEVVAKQIHRFSLRANGPVVCVNCGLFTPELAASELMGIVKGVATGVESRKGKFAVADGGSIFLDEIAEMPLIIQSMLLRVLQERVITPVGTTREIPVDVRVIAATNKDLAELVNKGKFREDLLYRLSIVHLVIPPLRNRRKDIPDLLRHLYRRHGGNGPIPLNQDELKEWQDYHWPGNIRQLENALINRMIMGQPIDVNRSAPISAYSKDSVIDLSVSTDFSEIKNRVFNYTLTATDGNIREAARRLGIAKSTLWEYVKRRDSE